MSNDEPEATGLILPRPNLGPEPWEEPRWPTGWIAGAVLSTLLCVALLAQLRRGRRHSRPISEIPESELDQTPPSPREELIAQAHLVKDALVSRFGEPWRAKTTEEIARELERSGAFDLPTTETLLAFLRDADRAKFGRESDQESQGWASWVGDFLAGAGASSSTRGK